MNYNTDYMEDVTIVITITDKEDKSIGKKISTKCSNGAVETRSVCYPNSFTSNEVNSVINSEIRRSVNFIMRNLNFK